ncbi:hypothetical protein FA95DRAFT_1103996 [Auriscalpium vulgare]|uniref:Uncharacterized protein n=1 Tax=Auriscalpium vulgare TaxID=40419 RepID=A0ACB8R4N7_9AGAM|nr:hypothetical protein FA95DRAFT_1103996 [Auriscalpium vulgare]
MNHSGTSGTRPRHLAFFPKKLTRQERVSVCILERRETGKAALYVYRTAPGDLAVCTMRRRRPGDPIPTCARPFRLCRLKQSWYRPLWTSDESYLRLIISVGQRVCSSELAGSSRDLPAPSPVPTPSFSPLSRFKHANMDRNRFIAPFSLVTYLGARAWPPRTKHGINDVVLVTLRA